MGDIMKFSIVLLLVVVACGEPVTEVRAVKDQRYSMSLKKIADHRDRYQFEICRLVDNLSKQFCFNPFVVDGGKAMEFAGKPDVKYLQIEGATKKTARYAVKTVAIAGFGAFILVFVPKAVRYAFVELFKMSRKTADPKKVAKPFEQEVREGEIMALAKGQRWNKEQFKKKLERYGIFDSKLVKILVSLFIVEGAIDAVDILYDLYKDLDQGLAKGRWGDNELELFRVYPQLLSDTQGEATVGDLSRLVETLRQHLGLAFSDSYLIEFAATTN